MPRYNNTTVHYALCCTESQYLNTRSTFHHVPLKSIPHAIGCRPCSRYSVKYKHFRTDLNITLNLFVSDVLLSKNFISNNPNPKKWINIGTITKSFQFIEFCSDTSNERFLIIYVITINLRPPYIIF